MKRYNKPLTAKELAELPDEEIDTSDIPELDEEWFGRAKLVMPPTEPKEQIALRVDRDVLEFFRKQGRGYQTRMNAVLRAFMEANRKEKHAG